MKIRVGYELVFDFPQSTPVIMVLGTHFTRASGHRQLEGPESADSRDCTVVVSLCRNGNAADFRPAPECPRPGSSVLGGSEVIATEIEQVVDLVAG